MQLKEFKIKMALNQDTLSSIAKDLGIHRNTLKDKVEGVKAIFNQNELNYFIDHWNLTPNEFVHIFFNKE